MAGQVDQNDLMVTRKLPCERLDGRSRLADAMKEDDCRRIARTLKDRVPDAMRDASRRAGPGPPEQRPSKPVGTTFCRRQPQPSGDRRSATYGPDRRAARTSAR